MTSYFVDEALHVADRGRLVVLHQRNRSSHRDPRPYDVRVHDRSRGEIRDLGTAQALGDRRPAQVFTALAAPRALLHFHGHAGEAVLRLVDLDTGAIVAERSDAGHVPHALDATGTRVLLADYPFQREWAVLDLETGDVLDRRPFPEGTVFGRRAVHAADGWWATLQVGKKHALLRLIDGEQVPLPAAPWGLSAGGDKLAVGLGNNRAGVVRDAKLKVHKLFPDAPAKSAVEVALAWDASRLLARSSLLEATQVLGGARRELPIAEEAWGDDLLLRLPGIACLPDGDLVCRGRLLTWYSAT